MGMRKRNKTGGDSWGSDRFIQTDNKQITAPLLVSATHPSTPVATYSYGGVVFRDNIAAKADWYITDIHQFVDLLKGGTGDPPAKK